MLRIITSNSDKLFIGVNVDDLEWPWTPKIGVFSDFLRFPAVTHILRMNCTKMAGDGSGQAAYDILAQNVHFWESKFRSLKFKESQIYVVFQDALISYCCRSTLIAKAVGSLLSRVTWALLKLLVDLTVSTSKPYLLFKPQMTVQKLIKIHS